MHSSETIKVVPARYPLRVVGALVALLVLAVVIQSVAFNPRWEWGVFARWFFDPVILEGLGQTLLLTLLGTVLSVIFGGTRWRWPVCPHRGCSAVSPGAISGCFARCR